MHVFTDEELVNQYLETKQNAYFDRLYKRYCAKVYRKCLSFAKDGTQADDLMQDVFLRVLLKLHSYKQEAKFSTWLYAITFNHCTDHTRLQHRRNEVPLDSEGKQCDLPTDDGLAERNEAESRYMRQALAKLSANEQSMLRMKYQGDVSIKALATHYSLTESAVKMRLKRSREKLRRFYQQMTLD